MDGARAPDGTNAGSAAANAALFDLDFTGAGPRAEDFFEVVAVCDRGPRANRHVALVVDGDAHAADRTAELLRRDGWHVVIETTPRDAARHMTRLGAPDLLLLEADLPQMSGFEFLARLRANRHVRGTPVVILAARATRADLVRALEAGADGYISKSVDDSRLLAALEKLIGGAAQG